MTQKIITNSAEETKNWASDYAQNLRGGEIIGLIGDLGAGKTTFSQGVAKGLGINDNVNSPTFVIMKIYPIQNSKAGIKNLVHIDAYRLESEKDLESIGALEYFRRRDTVVLIEWAQKLKKALANNAELIYIKSEKEKRIFEIKKRC